MATLVHTGRDSFPELKNDLFIKAAWGKAVDRVPVWVMRQAGRYLPEFREFRQKYEFFEICKDPQLASEVTMMPINRFNLDAAIIFSDILVVPQALGMQVEIKAQSGINIPDHLTAPEEMFRLQWPTADGNLSGLEHVYQAIRCTRLKLNGKVPLIGFSGGPWTLMCYMIEGSGSNTMSNAKKWLYKWPEYSHKLLSMLSDVIAHYLVGQIMAGAQAVQLFESNAGYLGPAQFKIFLLPYLRTISDKIKQILEVRSVPVVPLMIFAKGVHYALNEIGSIGYDVVSLDWTVSAQTARRHVGENVTLQGNLDPCALYSDKESIKSMTTDMLNEFGTKRYIANLGHGIYPDVEPEHLGTFIDTIHNISEKLIAKCNK